jgi:hypothetical protein
MNLLRQLSIAERLAALAGLIAAVAAAAGFIPGLYRDSAPLIAQSHGQDLGTLLVGLPVLALGLWASARGSLRGRLVVLGALGYLLYTYAVYAFVSVLGPLTVLDIAVVGVAGWSFAGSLPALADADVEATVGGRLPRRATGIFLIAIALCFAVLWLGQIAGATVTGVRPQALIDAGWPTSPIYVLDLGFVLPVCALSGMRLLRGRPGGARLAVPILVFVPVFSLGILALTRTSSARRA